MTAMRFGYFMAPFHPVGQNPTLALERDLDLVVALDRFGFDEVWVGEHHSAGFEIIASPEVFLGVAAERTKHIRLGTGVSSLPYHHPLMLADRMVLLDHLTRGRAMLGCGPGQLTSDAHMLGIPAELQRPRMHEALTAITHLLRSDEPLTMETDWFTIRDARLQLKSYSQPHLEIATAASISPTGAAAAGRHDTGLLSIAATSKQGFDALGTHWGTWNEVATEHGHVADRNRWRLVGPMHLARTKEQARAEVAYGILEFSRYFTHVLPAGPVRGDTPEEIIANIDEDGFAIIGTPEDAIEKIQSLVDESGGFGTFLLFGHDWATPRATLDSLELFAQYVMPHFQGQLDAPAASCQWVTGSGGEFVNRAANAIMKAIGDYAEERTTKT
jgi:limonene 1,2-monooxygenase